MADVTTSGILRSIEAANSIYGRTSNVEGRDEAIEIIILNFQNGFTFVDNGLAEEAIRDFVLDGLRRGTIRGTVIKGQANGVVPVVFLPIFISVRKDGRVFAPVYEVVYVEALLIEDEASRNKRGEISRHTNNRNVTGENEVFGNAVFGAGHALKGVYGISSENEKEGDFLTTKILFEETKIFVDSGRIKGQNLFGTKDMKMTLLVTYVRNKGHNGQNDEDSEEV